MTYVLLFLVAIVFFLYLYSTRTFNYWKKRNVAGPKPLPLFGNLKESALRRKHVGIIYKEIYDQFPDEKVIGIYRMISPAVLVRDLDVIKNILVKDFEAFPERGIRFSKDRLGDNVFHCDSDTWRALRNKLTPLFTTGKLKSTFHLLTERADKLVEHIENVSQGRTELEVYQYFHKYTISTIMAFAFGLDVDVLNDKSGMLCAVGKSMFSATYRAELDMLYPNILRYFNKSLYSELVNKFCSEVVQTVVNQRNGAASARNDIMDVLLLMKKEGEIEKEHGDFKKGDFELTDAVMAGQVFITVAAGFGNNGISLSYIMYQLAKNPKTQDKLIKEIDEVLERHNGELTYDSLAEMKYLDYAFSEILRMNPLTNSVQRASIVDYKVPGTDMTIEKNTTVIISPYAVHHDEKLYPDPEQFDPERFSPENSKDRHSCAFLPFGVGPRICLGMRFAKQQFGVAVVKMLSKFRVEPSERTKSIDNYDPQNTLIFTIGGVYVNLVPRKSKIY